MAAASVATIPATAPRQDQCPVARAEGRVRRGRGRRTAVASCCRAEVVRGGALVAGLAWRLVWLMAKGTPGDWGRGPGTRRVLTGDMSWASGRFWSDRAGNDGIPLDSARKRCGPGLRLGAAGRHRISRGSGANPTLVACPDGRYGAGVASPVMASGGSTRMASRTARSWPSLRISPATLAGM